MGLSSHAKAEATRERIIEAASHLLCKHGYCGVSVGEIMAAARLTVGGYYNDEVKAKLWKILQGADPPISEAAVQNRLHEAEFGGATRFFSSRFWEAWLTIKTA